MKTKSAKQQSLIMSAFQTSILVQQGALTQKEAAFYFSIITIFKY